MILAVVLASMVLAVPGGPKSVDANKSVARWVEDLGSPDIRTRWLATYSLGQLRAGPAAVALERVLANRNEEEYVRGGAAWALGRRGPKAPASTVRSLTEGLGSTLVSVRRSAAAALGDVGDLARPTVPQLLGMLDDSDSSVRVAAAGALWKIDRHPSAIAALESTLGDRDGAKACQVAAALGELKTTDQRIIFRLAEALKHPDDDTRSAAAFSLGQVGPSAIPAVRAVVANGDERSKCHAVEALGWIGPPAVPALVEALKEDQPRISRIAARALGRLGPAAKAAESALLRTVGDPRPEVREAAAEALRQIRGE
jgi:HEAT repeat protein